MYTPENRHREGFYGLSKRAVFVLDRAGIVRYAWISDDALVLPDMEAVLAAVGESKSPVRRISAVSRPKR